MKAAVRFRDRLKEDLTNPEFKKAFDAEEIYSSLAIQIEKLREKERISQKELAKRLHTTQQTVSRLENSHNRSFSLYTLIKLAEAFNKRLEVKFS